MNLTNETSFTIMYICCFNHSIFMKFSKIAIFSVIAVLAIATILWISKILTPNALVIQNGSENKITVFKSASCGCCDGYITYLKKAGLQVETIVIQDMNSIKEKYGIPSSMQSCHTSVVGNYFIEGHVPIEAVIKLLEDKPDIDGIALPGMPSGAPGMGGISKGALKIYSISDGASTEFMTV